MENLKSIQKILTYFQDNRELQTVNELESLFVDYENLIEHQRTMELFIQIEFSAYYLNLVEDIKYIRFMQSNTYFLTFILNVIRIINLK
jgi:hypothetical protein